MVHYDYSTTLLPTLGFSLWSNAQWLLCPLQLSGNKKYLTILLVSYTSIKLGGKITFQIYLLCGLLNGWIRIKNVIIKCLAQWVSFSPDHIVPRLFNSRGDILIFTINQCCMLNSDPEYEVRCIFSRKAFLDLAIPIIVIPKFHLHKNLPYMHFYFNILIPRRYHAFISIIFVTV